MFRSYFKVIWERGHSSLSWGVLVCFTTDPCSDMWRKITLIYGRNYPNLILDSCLFPSYTSFSHNAAHVIFWSYTEANCIYFIEFIYSNCIWIKKNASIVQSFWRAFKLSCNLVFLMRNIQHHPATFLSHNTCQHVQSEKSAFERKVVNFLKEIGMHLVR